MTASLVVAILILAVISYRLIRSRQREAHHLESLIESLFLNPSDSLQFRAKADEK